MSQKSVILTLRNEVRKGKIAHAYIYTGPKGTGKTTCARIFSKAINCENPSDGNPCCKCEICEGLENSKILDVIEIDGASNNGIDDVRALRNEADFVPSVCRYRVYIIDEVHMLSSSAFNALLKILEEPPSHVVFILATTEIYKVPQTILSRCQRFNFGKIKLEDLKYRLKLIASNENIEIEEEAIEKIAKFSDGAMRDAISALDKCSIAYDEVSSHVVDEILGLVDEAEISKLHEAISKKELKVALNIVSRLYENGKEVKNILQGLVQFYHDLMILNVEEASKRFKLEEILKAIEETLSCLEGLKDSSNNKLKLELTVLKLSSILNEQTKMRKSHAENARHIVENCDVTENEVEKPKLQEHEQKQKMPIDFEEFNPMENWKEILECLKQQDSCKMICGFLKDSKAYVKEDMVYIEPRNSVVNKIVLERKDQILQAIKRKTGKNFKIFVKETNKVIEFGENKLRNFLSCSKESGVEISEEPD